MSADERQFVDTNILVYAYDTLARNKRPLALKLVDELWQSGNGCLSVQVLQEFYVTVTAKIKDSMSVDSAAQLVSYFSAWKVHIPGVNDISQVIDIQRRYRISFWDAMIVNSAARLGCSVIWSEDLADGQEYESVLVQNPFIEKG
jgi:predicted nucleic acid-binding protein